MPSNINIKGYLLAYAGFLLGGGISLTVGYLLYALVNLHDYGVINPVGLLPGLGFEIGVIACGSSALLLCPLAIYMFIKKHNQASALITALWTAGLLVLAVLVGYWSAYRHTVLIALVLLPFVAYSFSALATNKSRLIK